MTPEREAVDLVERLNGHRSSDYMCQDCYGNVMDEAAEEIARLRTALATAERESDEARLWQRRAEALQGDALAMAEEHAKEFKTEIAAAESRAASLEGLLTEAGTRMSALITAAEVMPSDNSGELLRLAEELDRARDTLARIEAREGGEEKGRG